MKFPTSKKLDTPNCSHTNLFFEFEPDYNDGNFPPVYKSSVRISCGACGDFVERVPVSSEEEKIIKQRISKVLEDLRY